MALPDWQQKVLPPEYRADVSFGLSTPHVRVSDNGLGVGHALLRSHLGLGAREAYTFGHGRDVLGLQSGLVKAEYPRERPPSLQPPSSNNSWMCGATFLRNFVPPAGSILSIKIGGVEWWDFL